MKIEISDTAVVTKEITTVKGTFKSSSQSGWVNLPNGERRKVNIRLSKDQQPFTAGHYAISDASFTVDEYGNLALKNLQLTPVK